MQFLTAGESHGPQLTAVVTGCPAGVHIDAADIDRDLARRQGGYGRGGRQRIERDAVEVLSGVRFSRALGTPITLAITNADFANWTDRMSPVGDRPADLVRETHPRPGHADLAGMLKIGSDDARDVLERSSARETAARVAAGGIAKALLAHVGVEVRSFVRRIGPVAMDGDMWAATVASEAGNSAPAHPDVVQSSSCYCPDAACTREMEAAIDAAREGGYSLGGEFTVVATGLVTGLGSYASGPERLTSKIGGAVLSIPAIKGVEFGLGFAAAGMPGNEVHDPILYDGEVGYHRTTNNAGGLEGGMTSGEPLVVSAAMKPIPTMMRPLATVDTDTREPCEASRERSDVCAVPAASVVAEAEVAMVLADAYCAKFGADDLDDMLAALGAYAERIL